MTLVIGVVRRWVETDRDAFFAARRQRKRNQRIGFAEDLRDEALTAVVFLFVLIPLGLSTSVSASPGPFNLLLPCFGATASGSAQRT